MSMKYPPRMTDEEFDEFLRKIYVKYGGKVPKRLEDKDPVRRAYGRNLMKL